MFLGNSSGGAVAMDSRRLRIKSMHKVKVILWLQCLLLADDDKLVLVDSSLDLLEVLLTDIVQVDSLDIGPELSIRGQTRS